MNKKQCKSAARYKGIRFPTCNNGNPCKACLAIYRERHKPTNPVCAATVLARGGA